MPSTRIAFVTIALFIAPAIALASGDPGVVFLFFGQALMVAAFIAALPAFRNWRERLFASVIFFSALVGVSLLTAGVPYSTNSHWLIPAHLGVPLAAWGLAAFALRALRRRAA